MKSLSIMTAFILMGASLIGCSKAAFEYTGVPGTLNVPMGERISESFMQNKAQGEVDILIVSDNSGSMADEQEKLSERFKQFTQAFDQIDYHIGIITTDVENNTTGSRGQLIQPNNKSDKILKSNIPGVDNIFRSAVRVGTTGSGNEQPLMASIMAFEKRNAENAGFFRDGTDLAILVLSDEDEGSTGVGATADDVMNAFEKVWGDTKRLMGFGIIVKPGDSACLQSQTQSGAFYGTRVADLALKTGGEVFSICDEDYSDSLKAIGQKVRNLVFSIELSHSPLPQTVHVEISTGQKISYRIEGSRIVFDRAPRQGAKIIISYNRPPARTHQSERE